MVLRGIGILEPGTAAGRAAAGGRGADELAEIGSFAKRGERAAARAGRPCSHGTPWDPAGYRAYLRGRPGISRFGAGRCHRPLSASATHFVGLISTAANPCLRASAATRTMRAFLKGLSY